MTPARPARSRLATRAGLLFASLAVLLATQPLAPASAAPARAPGDDFKWSVVPSSSKGPTVRSRFEYGLKPGEEVSDWVAVSNLGTKPLKVSVYATDAFNAPDGGFALLPASEQPKDVGSWITLPRRDYTVPVGKRVDIPFRVKVPANAEPGDHIGGLIAGATESTTNEQGQQVNVERRIASRVYLRVDGPAQPAAEITRVDAVYDNPLIPFGGGDMTVTYQVANTGNVRFSGKARIEVRGPLGVRVANSEVIDIPELLPDSEIRITRKLAGVFPAGRLDAQVTVNPQVDNTALSLTESRSMWAVPWLLVAVPLLLVGLLLFWLLRRRRFRRLAVEAELVGRGDAVPSAAASRSRAVVLAAVALALAGAPGAMSAQVPGALEPTAGVEIGVSIAPPTVSPTASPTATASPRPSPSPTDGTGGGGGDLPRTGLAIGAFVAVGAALVGGGAGLRVAARRRAVASSATGE
ncbi:WxL protein peptidoglycan domain-containing protein [Phytohabitans houttuyneae]|uniref:DUF916 domain-containing protein n=1 Tax=Phytohabitans houttuyneae TaxID=1076126 RepID=A0A6V8KJX7_9ACTN|nr:DUF916 domain-containing protein [Phytohabitans houttuyneae]GFJ85433.1 hypothetical protein Phou_096130 [Phytohabitans houttuyneae]